MDILGNKNIGLIDINSSDSHQISPSYVLTFVRWNNRDTTNYSEPDPFDLTRNPLVVISDCIQLEISNSKTTLTPNLNLVLKAGDTNYASAVGAGDYVLVNLLNDEQSAIRVAEKARDSKPINEYQDGFKGLFKIQKIRRKININPQNGTKTHFYVVHAFGFSELNTVIYFNPIASASFKEKETLFLSSFSKQWSGFATALKNVNNVQKALTVTTKGLLSIGINSAGLTVSASENSGFKIPPLLGKLLGRPKSKTISDVYNFIYGIWKKSTNASTEKEFFNPGITRSTEGKNFYITNGGTLKGFKVFAVEDFNYKQIWSILTKYSNSAINEGYTATRVSPDGRVYPTVIFRQKPFNSQHFDQPIKLNGQKGKSGETVTHTKFFDLPRWRISPNLIYSIDLGKDEVGRINYLQLFGRSVSVIESINQGYQATNVFFEPEDIKRHGIKPAIIDTDFDFWQTEGKSEVQTANLAKKWAYLLFDMLNAGHLRESGTIVCCGIQEPIEVGDNLEFDNAVYHIEAVSHTMSVSPNGMKQFRTILTLSFGTSLDSTRLKPIYPQMEHADATSERKRDQEFEQILPGVSDTQDIPYSEGKSREKGELVKDVPSKSFTEGASKKAPRNRFSTLKYSKKE